MPQTSQILLVDAIVNDGELWTTDARQKEPSSATHIMNQIETYIIKYLHRVLKNMEQPQSAYDQNFGLVSA